MGILLVIVSVVGGAALWLWLVLRFDKFEPEPLGTVLLVGLGAGLAGFFFAGMHNSLFDAFLGITYDHVLRWPDALASAVFVGINEELVKFWATVLLVFRLRQFNEPIDAAVYATAAALGFASFENVFYALDYGMVTLVVRLITAVPLHLGTAAVWSLGLAKAKFLGRSWFGASWPYLAVAAFIHAVYDFFIFVLPGEYSLVSLALSLVMAVGLIVFMVRRLKRLQRQSPFAPGNVCPRCDAMNHPGSRFCAYCGAPIVQEFFKLCPGCGGKSLNGDRFCAKCGQALGG